VRRLRTAADERVAAARAEADEARMVQRQLAAHARRLKDERKALARELKEAREALGGGNASEDEASAPPPAPAPAPEPAPAVAPPTPPPDAAAVEARRKDLAAKLAGCRERQRAIDAVLAKNPSDAKMAGLKQKLDAAVERLEAELGKLPEML